MRLRGTLAFALVAFVLVLATVVLAGCGGDNESATPTTTDTTTTDTTTTEATADTTEQTNTATEEPSGSTSACSNAGDAVENYDILAAGASRTEYLTLLHKLQRDCPKEAVKRGLTADFNPQCKRLDQENCTMYKG